MGMSVYEILLYLPLSIALLWGLLHLFLLLTSRLFLFQWWRAPKFGEAPENAEIISFQHGSRELYGWFFTPEQASADKWVVFFHGNYTTIDRQLDAVEGYLKLGYQVFLPEYHGFRHLKGLPTRKKIRDDLLLILEHIEKLKHLKIEKSLFHCFSLGGIIGPDLLSDLNPQSVIIEASVPSPREFMRAYKIHHGILIDRYDNLPLLQNYQGKILIFSYLHDTIIPPAFMRSFKVNLPKAQFVEWPQQHNSIRRAPEAPEFWKTIQDFLRV